MGPLKCVIWDLDDTLWEGTVAEGDAVVLRQDMCALVRRLDAGGVVQSIASRNDADAASAVLERYDLADWFVHPQVGWGAKSVSVRRILDVLHLSADACVFVDDSPFERAEVASQVEGVRCLSPVEMSAFAAGGGIPDAASLEARGRPAAYREDARRRAAEASFEGTAVEFLASLSMELRVRPAEDADLLRAAELTERTNQLNTSGITYSVDELRTLVESSSHEVLIAELRDRFGDHGRVGLCVSEITSATFTIELLLLSCRVIGRNVGQALLAAVAQGAVAGGLALRSRHVPTGRNRQMQVTLAMLGFLPVVSDRSGVLYEHPCPGTIIVPDYIRVTRRPSIGMAAQDRV